MPRLTVRVPTLPSVEKKRALVQLLTEATVAAYSVEPGAVTVQIVEQDPGNWARGGSLITEEAETTRPARVP